MLETSERPRVVRSLSPPDVPRHRIWISRLALSLLLLLLVSGFSFFGVVRESELRIADTFFRLTPSPKQRSAVVLVLIDDESLHQYGRWPWSRELLGRLVRKIADNGARVIGLDVLLSEPQSHGTDTALEESLKASGRTVIVGKFGALANGPQWVEPLPQFSASTVAVGHAHAVLDNDGICRRFPPLELTAEGPKWAFALEIARLIDSRRTLQFLRLYGIPGDTDVHVVSAKPTLAPIFFRHGGFDTVSASTVLQGGRLPFDLSGRPVLVGFGAAELTDRLNTPLATELPSPGVEVHAQILDDLLTGHFLKEVPIWISALLLALTCFATVVLVRRWRGWTSIALLFVLAVAVYGGAFLTFFWALRVFSPGPMLFAIVMGPLVVYAADFTLVERSVTQQLEGLRAWLAKRGPEPSAGRTDLTWKLAVLQRLGIELGSLYELHQTLLESTQDLVAIFDENGRLLLENRSFAAAACFSDKSNFTLEQLHTRWKIEAEAPLMFIGSTQEGEVLLSGTLYTVRIAPLPPTRLSPGGGTLVTLSSLQTRVERDRARSEALAFITHELRTPLVSIQGFADLMIRYPSSPDCKDAPETILWESKRLLALINSYLDVLRLDAGAKPLQETFFDLTATVQQVFDILRPLAAAANMRLVVHPDSAVISIGDANLISGAVLNLVGNAIKYGKSGTNIEVTCSASTDEVVIGVQNRGKAIAMGDIPHLFDPYYRARDVEVTKSGWGLGLAFVRRIAEKHGGSVQVKSESSSTIFEIHLPMRPSAGVSSEITQ